MAGEPDSDKGRHIYGPRALGALVPAIARPAFRRRAPASAQLLADWPLIVGPALAAGTEPRRLAGGTLTVGCSGPLALELQHLADALIERINSHLGSVVVARLRFVQEAPRAAPPSPAARPEPPPLSLTELPPGALRAALERLGRAVLTRGGAE